MSDRNTILDAFRVMAGRSYPRNQWDLRWVSRDDLTAIDQRGNELNMTFSAKGRLSNLVHWVPDQKNPRYASRTPIYTGKREYVLDHIGGMHALHLRWLLTQEAKQEARSEARTARLKAKRNG